WSLLGNTASLCIEWPGPTNTPVAAGPLPDVPVLVLSGDRDVRTPTPGAVTIASRFPHAQVLVVPGSGHSVLNRSACAANAVRTWLDGGTPPTVCTRWLNGVPPLERFRRSVAATPPAAHVPGLTGRTVTALVQTLRDSEDAWLLSRQTKTPVSGLVGGTM